MKSRLQHLICLVASLFLAVLGAGCDIFGNEDENNAVGGGGVIAMSGGAGDNTTGGDGGYLYVEAYGNDIAFRSSGSVNASFSTPNPSWTTDLGTNGVTVSTDCTVLFLQVGVDEMPALGRLYVVTNNSALFQSQGDSQLVLDNAVAEVTGLQINAGATLTVPGNYTGYSGTATDVAELDFSRDLVVNGTLKSAAIDCTIGSNGLLPQAQRHGANATARDKAALDLHANRVLVGSAGTINTAGLDAAAGSNERGGDGGGLWIDATEGFVNRGQMLASGGAGDNNVGGNSSVYTSSGSDSVDGVYLWNDGLLLNTGSITANGGAGTSGGAAGYIDIESDASVYNTAALSANGGAGTGASGTGGDANLEYGVEIYSYYASVLNSGAINANGGDGKAGGGDGAEVYLYGGDDGYVGNAVNSGTISVSGGTVTGTSGDGGNGGDVNFYSYGKILNSGAITSNGGSGVGDAYYGGGGGDLYIQAYYGEDYDYGEDATPGPISFSGNISLVGGSGGAGGTGGDIDVYADDYSDYNYPAVMPITFYGYARVVLDGGAGGADVVGEGTVFAGGDAGDFEINTYSPGIVDIDYLPPGSITNEAAVSAKGGAASEGTGGYGGYVDFETAGDFFVDIPTSTGLGTVSVTTNRGNIDVSGGEGADGGDSGGVYFYGHYKVINSGNITANGGDATSTTGTGGGSDDDIEFYSTYDIENTGSIVADGGDGTGSDGDGGDGASIYMSAGQIVTCIGSVSANGGTEGGGEGNNGDGGRIDLFSGGGATVYGSLSAAKGTGGSGGVDGTVMVDWNMLFGTGAV